MYSLTKLAVLFLVYVHVQESPVLGQTNSRVWLFGSDLKQLLRIPEFKFQLPQKLLYYPHIEQYHHLEKFNAITNYIPMFNNEVITTEKGPSATYLPQIIKKNGEIKEIKAEKMEKSPEFADLSCDEQNKLIKSIFGEVDENSNSNNPVDVTQPDPEFTDNGETTTSNYDTTIFEGLDIRFHDPNLVATLVGR